MTRQTPGALRGAVAVLDGVRFLVGTPRSWPWAIVPAVVLSVLVGVAVWAAVAHVHPLLSDALPKQGNVAVRWGSVAAGWVGTGLAAIGGVLLAAVLAPPLSGPALERIVALREAELEVPAHRGTGFIAEIWAGARAEATALIVGVPIALLLFVVGLVVPPLQVVTVPLKFVLASLMLTWSLFDYPLTLRGVRMRQRIKLINAHGSTIVGFGAAVTALFWLPCFGVLMLPVAVAGATGLVWQILRSDPELLPEIDR